MENEPMAYLIVLIPISITVYYITSYNGYKTRLIRCEESYSGIDVALSKRYNLITNLVETLKGYAKHEQEVLTMVTNLRNINKDNLSEYNDTLDATRNQLFLLIENYPTLRADSNFLHLQKSLSDVEEHLQAARRLHNRNVSDYNTYIQMSPRNLIPIIKEAKPRTYFQALKDEQENVQIKM